MYVCFSIPGRCKIASMHLLHPRDGCGKYVVKTKRVNQLRQEFLEDWKKGTQKYIKNAAVRFDNSMGELECKDFIVKKPELVLAKSQDNGLVSLGLDVRQKWASLTTISKHNQQTQTDKQQTGSAGWDRLGRDGGLAANYRNAQATSKHKQQPC